MRYEKVFDVVTGSMVMVETGAAATGGYKLEKGWSHGGRHGLLTASEARVHRNARRAHLRVVK